MHFWFKSSGNEKALTADKSANHRFYGIGVEKTDYQTGVSLVILTGGGTGASNGH